jgi:ABC transport system ATP-binding/permease protein
MEKVTPVILTAKELDVHFGDQVILDNASLSVHEGDRIGLVGRNGAGKSTFLKIISGILPPDSGEITKRKDLVISFLSQEFTLLEGKTVFENVLDGAKETLSLLKEYESLPFDHPQKHILEVKILHDEGWELERKIEILLTSLHAPHGDRIVVTLSGGEKRRTALCRALISHPDLLILDEPTNHLDTNSIEWIENFLASYKGTCIFVTHDRYFLDRIATRIVELANGSFYSHEGNYTDYLINKSQRQAIKETEEQKRQNFLKRELQWIIKGPRARRTKAKFRIDNFNEVLSELKNDVELDVDLIIPPADLLGKKVLDLINVGAELGGKTLFKDFNFEFIGGRKLGIIGSNGVGKTTLLRILIGELPPKWGKVDIGEKTEFNYVDQTRLLLNDNDSVIEAIGEGNETIKFGKLQMKIWTYLRRFLFSDDRLNTKVGKLSGGEKSRLTLAKILKNGGNFLLLDEPTNDLDLPTLRILEEALTAFQGCVVIVSHDRYFLNRVCNGILAFEDNGILHFSEGNYDYYIEKINLRLKDQSAPEEKEKKIDPRVKPKTKKLSWKEQKELDSIEDEILNAEKEVDRIEQLFLLPDFYKVYALQVNQLISELNSAKVKVSRLYERWTILEQQSLDSSS